MHHIVKRKETRRENEKKNLVIEFWQKVLCCDDTSLKRTRLMYLLIIMIEWQMLILNRQNEW